MSNRLPGAANLAASGSPTDTLHPVPRSRPPSLRRGAWLPSTFDLIAEAHTIPLSPQPLLRVLPSFLAPLAPAASPTPRPADPLESREGAPRAPPGSLDLGRGCPGGAWPGRFAEFGAASPSAGQIRELLRLVAASFHCPLARLVLDLP